MNRIVETRPKSAKHVVRYLYRIALCLLFCVLPLSAASSDNDSQSRQQFATAVRMRTMLEGYLEKDRSVADYKQTIQAYHKVYLISTESEEVTPALIAEAELYEEMGRLYDPKFYQSAIDSYNFLLEQYPGSRYRSGAAFAIGRVQKDGLKKLADAQATFQSFLKKYPKSDKANDARQELKEIADARTVGLDRPMTASNSPDPNPPAPASSSTPPAQTNAPVKSGVASSRGNAPVAALVAVDNDPAVAGDRVEPRAADGHLASVKGLQTTNRPDASRLILLLDDTIQFQSARIASPDRIYFNLSRAKVGPKVGVKTDPGDGLLKSVHVGQNKPDVVRVVLDAPDAKDFTAYLLSKPYRLVIELQTKPIAVTKLTNPATNPVSAQAPAPDTTAAQLKPAELAAVLPRTSAGGMDPAANAVTAGSKPKTTRVALSSKADAPSTSLDAPVLPKPTHDGNTSLTRALGLKISRIVIDAGHGGHDTGTIGPHGLLEKDLCLDVALRLGKIIEQKLPSAEVVYTRKDDTFVPLEDRTRMANDAKADLFISIHANSSQDPAARGVETYYLNFATSADATEVAARENALAEESVHDLQDVLQKIARNDKIAESKELAGDIQTSLSQRMASISTNEKNRGVKKAPFVVLIGADMPSVLSEISFVSNPYDERLLKKTDQRQRIADGLYRGIASYLDSLNSLSSNQQRFLSDDRAADGRPQPGTTPAPVSSTK